MLTRRGTVVINSSDVKASALANQFAKCTILSTKTKFADDSCACCVSFRAKPLLWDRWLRICEWVVSHQSTATTSLVLLYSLWLLTGSICAQSMASSSADSAPKRLIVKLKNATPNQFFKFSARIAIAKGELGRINAEFGVIRSQSFLPQTTDRSTSFGDVQILTFDESADIVSIQSHYQKLSFVEYAEPDYQMELFVSPNDSLYSKQWNLRNYGQSYWKVLRYPGDYNDVLVADSGLAGADIAADAVFTNPPARTQAIIAIIDTGIDFIHPDLVGQIWTNAGEYPENGLDDDHNGYIDDLRGWDFSANDTTLIPILEDNDPSDNYGHGTHIAGIIAAAAGNGVGIAGIAPHCRIMPLKIYPMMLASTAARAIIYATDNGADVISISWGAEYPSKLLEDALSYARTKGVILCASSGNSGIQEAFYPAALPLTLAIGATDSRDRVTIFSSYGPHIDVVAPGESILSLRAQNTDMYALPPSNEPGVHIVADKYYEASGTSMACPMVAAIAGYLKSVSPGITPSYAQEIIQLSAKDLRDPYGVGGNYPGRDIYSGFGRASLQKALALAPTRRASIESPARRQLLSGIVSVTGIADGVSFGGYTLDYGAGDDPEKWQRLAFSARPVTHAQLAVWNTDSLDGTFCLRLRVGDVNESQVVVHVANHDFVDILSPAVGDTLTGPSTIIGSASSRDFLFATLEYGKGTAPTDWKSLDTLIMPVCEGHLLDWDVSALAEGNYVLRLVVHTSRGPIPYSVNLYVRSPFSGSNGWRTHVGDVTTIVPNYGDFDGDGRFEIVVGTSEGIRFCDPDGNLKTDGMPDLPVWNFRMPIAVGNLDGDGIDDFVAVCEEPPMMFVVRSDRPSWRAVNLPRAPGVGQYDVNQEVKFPVVFLTDINGDGRDEIHFLSSGRGFAREYCFYHSDGESWSAQDKYAGVESCLPVDLDNDHIAEIYCLSTDSLRGYDLAGREISAAFLNIATPFDLQGMSAVDVDDDGKLELLVFGRYPSSPDNSNYWLFAFGENLSLENGWPREIPINRYLVPSMPVFGDLDGDSLAEYVTSCWDMDFGYVYAWQHNGLPYLDGSGTSGFFAAMPERSMLNMPILADLDTTSGAEIISCALPDVWGISQRESIVAWSKTAQLLPGWPLTAAFGPNISKDYANTPVVGDINKDGKIDVIMTTALGDLVFINFPDRPIRADGSPCPMWRYNRRLNNIAPLSPGITTDVADEPGQGVVPTAFALWQNYPNPFNTSTIISFSLAQPSNAKIEILNILGQTVRSFDLGLISVGGHVLEWTGTDDRGQEVSSGVYLYRITAGDKVAVRKMILLK
jgi:subtilisin family serine protease